MPRQSAQDLAYMHLLAEIVAGRLPAGARIKPEEIAEALGVSRMPVREAMRQLDAEGFVTIRPNRGAIVTERGPDDVLELFEMRSVLEGLAARLGVPRAAPLDIEDLDAEAQAMRRAAADPARWLERHEAFHDRLTGLAARPRLAAEVRRLRLAVHPYLQLYAEENRDPETLGHEHDVIVDAIRQGDAALAERLVVGHVLANAASIARLLSGVTAGGTGRRLLQGG